MAFHVRDTATDAAVRRLAHLKGMTLTETIRTAVDLEYFTLSQTPPLVDRLRTIQAQFAALRQAGGQPADKAFFDELSGDA